MPAGGPAEDRRDGPDPPHVVHARCVPNAMMPPSLVQSAGAGTAGAGEVRAAVDDNEHVERSIAEVAVAGAPGVPAAEMQTSMIPPRRISGSDAAVRVATR